MKYMILTYASQQDYDGMAGKDTGSLDFGPDGGFASLITFPDPANPVATLGQIRLRGQLDQVEGTTSGDYVGTFCR